MVHLKKAENADIADLISIEKSVSGLKTYSPMTTEDEWLVALDIGTVYLIKKDDEVVGSICYEPKKDGRIHISGLVVDPRFQGQGIGREAMELVLEELQDARHKSEPGFAKVIDLAVHPENTRALKLYESLGFTRGELKENYYGDGEPRLILELKK